MRMLLQQRDGRLRLEGERSLQREPISEQRLAGGIGIGGIEDVQIEVRTKARMESRTEIRSGIGGQARAPRDRGAHA